MLLQEHVVTPVEPLVAICFIPCQWPEALCQQLLIPTLIASRQHNDVCLQSNTTGSRVIDG